MRGLPGSDEPAVPGCNKDKNKPHVLQKGRDQVTPSRFRWVPAGGRQATGVVQEGRAHQNAPAIAATPRITSSTPLAVMIRRTPRTRTMRLPAVARNIKRGYAHAFRPRDRRTPPAAERRLACIGWRHLTTSLYSEHRLSSCQRRRRFPERVRQIVEYLHRRLAPDRTGTPIAVTMRTSPAKESG